MSSGNSVGGWGWGWSGQDASGLAAVQIYADKVKAIATANLIAYWPLWETSGSVADNYEGTAARDGAYTGVALNNSTFSNGDPVGLWDGSNDYCNIHSASLNTAFGNGQEGTVSIWVKVSAAGIWTDSTSRRAFQLRVDDNNRVILNRTTTNNQLAAFYIAGGTTDTLTISTSSTGWIHLALTWSKANDQMIAYLNGTQTGSTQTGIGTWAGSLDNASCMIGARSTTPNEVWSGYLAHCALWTTPLSAAQVAQLATV